MPTISIPVVTYSVRNAKPAQKYGSPEKIPVSNTARLLARIAMDKVPRDAVITNATLRFFAAKAHGGASPVSVRPITEGWGSKVNWNRQPNAGAVIQTLSPSGISWGHAYSFNVTAWAVGRSPRGLRLESNLAWDNPVWLMGSRAPRNRPVLLVTYSVPAAQPGGLKPNGGWVSDPQPPLTYAGDPDMDEQQVQFSADEGATVSFDSGWLAATSGRYDPAGVVGAPVLSPGGEIKWRVRTRGPDGTSAWSVWAEYGYQPLPTDLVITSPGPTSSDGSPPLVWTVTGQQSFKVDLYDGSRLIDSSGWRNEPATRDWTPAKGVKVPDGIGRFVLSIKDSVSPRVVAEEAPTVLTAEHTYTTTLTGAGTPVDTLVATWDDPLVTFTGVRAAGIPDEVGLFRDGVQVPIWDGEGNGYPGWAPGPGFFDGTAYSVTDYTADPRHEHTWEVRVRVNGVISAGGPTYTQRFTTRSVWLINPDTGQKVEILGHNDVPTVDMATTEESIVHLPINGGFVEAKRRRLTRTTKAGSVEGVVLNEHEHILDDWVEVDSSQRYRLVFGKTNWPVIIGDYSPVQLTAYPDACGPDRVLISFNWWQRLADF